MQKYSFSVVAAASITAFAVLAGCSGAATQWTGSAAQSARVGAPGALADAARSGVAPKFLALVRLGTASRAGVMPNAGASLFVDDFTSNAVEILKNNSWANKGEITDGISAPDGNWLDTFGLYVANYASNDITQYQPPSQLTFTYNARMMDPVAVTTDFNGNVYEADYAYPHGHGFVNEYAQKSNTVIAHCSPGGAAEGVAVDQRGDVFLGYNSGSLGYITEYQHGLRGCNGILLPLPLGFIGGMALDKQKDLIVCDQLSATVDVIAPPYQTITHTLGSGYYDPFHVTINRRNNRAYVTDLGAGDVQVLEYPSGTLIATLGAANGLTLPSSAVDTNNYVP